MGNSKSKTALKTSFDIFSLNNNLQYKTELSSYEAACGLDADLQSFDTTLHGHTDQIIRTLRGVEAQALPFDSLKEVIEGLLGMNRDVLKVILDCKEDIWENKEIFGLVEEYFENSSETLKFWTALEKCLMRARVNQLIIPAALQQFEEETEVGRSTYERTLQELKNFKAADDPFTQELFQIFESVCKQQTVMLEKLQLRKNKLDKKIKCIRTVRKVSWLIFAATFVSLLICSIVAAAIASPHTAAVLAASGQVGSMGKWIDSLWNNYENALKGQEEVISLMHRRTFLVIKDLERIRDLIERLKNQIESLLQTVDFAIEKEAVKVAMEDIKKRHKMFMEKVEALEVQVDTCSSEIHRGMTMVLDKIRITSQ